MGNKAAKKKKIAEAAKLAKANAAAAKEQQKPEVTNEKVVEVANVNEISAEPVVITPPRKKETIAVDLVAVKKAVDASSSVQEARRIAREAKEQASRASVTAEAIIKETQDIINKDNNTVYTFTLLYLHCIYAPIIASWKLITRVSIPSSSTQQQQPFFFSSSGAVLYY